MNATILIKNVLHNNKKTNILIEGNRFKSMNAASDVMADTIIEADGMAILPPFYNTHTHAAMTVLRGYADDMALNEWLTEHIWPFEGTLTAEDMYLGTRLAILEMIKSGTVFFNDMYFNVDVTTQAIREMGIRASIGATIIGGHPLSVAEERYHLVREWNDPTGRIMLTPAPHAVYTVNEDLLQSSYALSQETHTKWHIHLSETASEVQDCVKAHGTTPIRYLEQLGVLGPNVIAAHVVHVDDEEIQILKERGVTIAHNPCSNMKLASGIFNYKKMIDAGLKITLATDGCSSNNNLDMREEMKMAALLAKVSTQNPACLPATEVFKWATVNGAQAFDIDAGVIEEGKLADALLINLNNERMTPFHNLISNWVYAADSSCIDTVICDGNIVMRNHHVEGEEEIIAAVQAKYPKR